MWRTFSPHRTEYIGTYNQNTHIVIHMHATAVYVFFWVFINCIDILSCFDLYIKKNILMFVLYVCVCSFLNVRWWQRVFHRNEHSHFLFVVYFLISFLFLKIERFFFLWINYLLYMHLNLFRVFFSIWFKCSRFINNKNHFICIRNSLNWKILIEWAWWMATNGKQI